MSVREEEIYICKACEGEVDEADDFCPHCGALFGEGEPCDRHPEREAEGVCAVCGVPLCEGCGAWTNGVFLCVDHSGYEIIEGLGRVFGGSDAAHASHVSGCLEQAGLHPFIYERKTSPLSVGGPDHTLFRASGEFDGHIVNEIKVMVPCREIVEAERHLRDLGFLS